MNTFRHHSLDGQPHYDICSAGLFACWFLRSVFGFGVLISHLQSCQWMPPYMTKLSSQASTPRRDCVCPQRRISSSSPPIHLQRIGYTKMLLNIRENNLQRRKVSNSLAHNMDTSTRLAKPSYMLHSLSRFLQLLYEGHSEVVLLRHRISPKAVIITNWLFSYYKSPVLLIICLAEANSFHTSQERWRYLVLQLTHWA